MHQYIQYGVQHIETLLKLEQMNLLKKQTQKCHWEVIMDGLKLVNDEVDQEIPMDFSYVYLAYAPITSRLVEQTFSIDNWKKITRELELIPGPTLFNDHRVEVGKKKTMIVVYFIGGVTYGEIATLRWMGQRYNKEIIIATTHIINGKKFFDDIVSSDKQNNQSNKSNQEQQQEQLNKEEHQQQ
ncbi:Sec1-like protein [Pseudocohnilembus persalinus]|uniref:Sec1-like protein n=1 Tax=Pseudocohnilembus persalinus TaxID=266149 RepID=A0A0V0QDJ0_PSEPJ|nr:Sec1-like protein [Pseudocohnilembus persalinus]|eukprot:KRX00270.1 Sec1-like protein [Pseudocohnilembus persalinus]